MSDPSDEPPIDRQLLDEARPALGPTDAQRARLKRAVLAAAVGTAAAGTAVASGTGSATSAAGLGLGAKVAVAVFAVAALGGGAYLVSQGGEAAVPGMLDAGVVVTLDASVVSDDAAPEPEDAAPAPDDAAPEPEDAAEPRTVRTPPVASDPDLEDLAAIEHETELLREANAALQRGDAQGALAAIEQHQRQFPRGALALERRGLRILALCAAGDEVTARREAGPFLAAHPPAGLAARVQRSCAAP